MQEGCGNEDAPELLRACNGDRASYCDRFEAYAILGLLTKMRKRDPDREVETMGYGFFVFGEESSTFVGNLGFTYGDLCKRVKEKGIEETVTYVAGFEQLGYVWTRAQKKAKAKEAKRTKKSRARRRKRAMAAEAKQVDGWQPLSCE